MANKTSSGFVAERRVVKKKPTGDQNDSTEADISLLACPDLHENYERSKPPRRPFFDPAERERERSALY
jgi:hypothetical protein